MTKKLTILAWVGEDEMGSGEVGIKRIISGGQYVALALTEGQKDAPLKLTDPHLLGALQQQADMFGKPLTLMRFEAVEPVQQIAPRKR